MMLCNIDIIFLILRLMIARDRGQMNVFLLNMDTKLNYHCCRLRMLMKSILITGANRGIGLGIVQELVSGSSSPELIFAGYRDENKSQVIAINRVFLHHAYKSILGIVQLSEEISKCDYSNSNWFVNLLFQSDSIRNVLSTL